MLATEASQHQHQTEERKRAATLDCNRQKKWAEVTRSLADGLRHFSDGDFTYQIDQPLPADFEAMRTDFNGAVSQLRGAKSAVARTTTAIDSGSREISSSADDLSKRTEPQDASLEETAAALGEITIFTKPADEARTFAIQANESAHQSGTVVASAVDAIRKKLVSETRDTLSAIEAHTFTINQHMDSIATSAREQSVSLSEVNTAVSQIDHVTQQNASMVEETNAASGSYEQSNWEDARWDVAQISGKSNHSVCAQRPCYAVQGNFHSSTNTNSAYAERYQRRSGWDYWVFSVPVGVVTCVGPLPLPLGVGDLSVASGGRLVPSGGLLSNVPPPDGWALIGSFLVVAVGLAASRSKLSPQISTPPHASSANIRPPTSTIKTGFPNLPWRASVAVSVTFGDTGSLLLITMFILLLRPNFHNR